MIDMKMDAAQASSLMCCDMMDANQINRPAYPEGLKIELEGESLKRLAMGEGNLPPVGKKYRLNAMVEVVEVCKEAGSIDTELCVELQIQQMELVGEKDMNAQISKFYG